MIRKIIFAAALAFVLCSGEVSLAGQKVYNDFISRVADGIFKLKGMYPQLADFSISRHADIKNMRIDYSCHTHEAQGGVGWTSAVPNPEKDGVWFYIDLHDKNSTAQIHTQPVMGKYLQFGNRNICFLILEGAATEPIAGKIVSILMENGAKSIQD